MTDKVKCCRCGAVVDADFAYTISEEYQDENGDWHQDCICKACKEDGW